MLFKNLAHIQIINPIIYSTILSLKMQLVYLKKILIINNFYSKKVWAEAKIMHLYFEENVFPKIRINKQIHIQLKIKYYMNKT